MSRRDADGGGDRCGDSRPPRPGAPGAAAEPPQPEQRRRPRHPERRGEGVSPRAGFGAVATASPVNGGTATGRRRGRASAARRVGAPARGAPRPRPPGRRAARRSAGRSRSRRSLLVRQHEQDHGGRVSSPHGPRAPRPAPPGRGIRRAITRAPTPERSPATSRGPRDPRVARALDRRAARREQGSSRSPAAVRATCPMSRPLAAPAEPRAGQ